MSRRGWTGTVAVAATYFFFLIFVQFGFLRLLETAAGEAAARVPLAAMGLSGLAGSLATGFLLGRIPALRLVRVGLVACAASALAALACHSVPAFVAVAALLGGATALLTVALAADLERWLGSAGYGLRVGWATGVAYALCNLPALFAATPSTQAALAAAGCLLSAALPGWQPSDGEVGARRRGDSPRLAGGVGALGVLAAFLALVWLDSGAFSIIQRSTELQALTWAGGRIWLQGASHLLGALAAGWLIDRGVLFGLLPGSFALFVLGFQLLGSGEAAGGPIYAVGIAAYSTALVAYPSLGAEAPGRWPRRWRAALVYGVAGWLGSALGIGMAERFHEIPRWFLLAAGLTMLAAAAAVRIEVVRSWLRLYGASALLATALWMVLWTASGWGAAGSFPGRGAAGDSGTHRLEPAPAREAKGRAVYIAEGCIHCHSQYVRPQAADERLWGPYRPLDRAHEIPALLGNRRLGPDLRNVGNRRSAAWQRRHLIEPSRLSPGSRMPSYAHLFADGDERGENLVAYLMSLGRESSEERYAMAQLDPVPDPLSTPSPARGRRLFLRYCSMCHGERAWGEGPLASEMSDRSLSLHRESFRLVSFGPGIGTVEEGLARVIRFGVPTTSMPGHETLGSREIADLVAYVASLQGTGGSAPETVDASLTRGENP